MPRAEKSLLETEITVGETIMTTVFIGICSREQTLGLILLRSELSLSPPPLLLCLQAPSEGVSIGAADRRIGITLTASQRVLPRPFTRARVSGTTTEISSFPCTVLP